MRRKRIVERFEEFKRNKETDEETNVKDGDLVDEIDNIDLEDSIGKKIKTKELSDKEMNDENVGDLVEEIKQYLKKIDERYGR